MPTFTVFGYGTGENHRETANIVSQFHKSCAGPHTFIDGPSLLGLEVEANALRGTESIKQWLIEQEDNDNTINLTGFSRGSVTCIYIANNLKDTQTDLEQREARGINLSDTDQVLLERLRNMDLNMFLMDPVAGMTDKGKAKGRVIPDNVNNYVAVIQKDERRRDFKPQDMTRAIISDPTKTKVSMLPMYGNHSDTTKIKSENMQTGPKLAWYALHNFLTQHGSRFTQDGTVNTPDQIPQIVNSKKEKTDLPPDPSARDLLKLFSVNHKERPHYYKSGLTVKLTDGIPNPRVERTLNEHTQYYVKNQNFFVNQLERELFKVAYPKAFNYLFEKNMPDPRYPKDSASSEIDVLAELQVIKANDPLLFESLILRGVDVKPGTDQITVGKPRGLNYLEPCMTVQQIHPDLVPLSVKQAAPEMNKLPLLEKEINRKTFQYQREKHELNFAWEKRQSDRAKQIREEINFIVNHGPGSQDEKHGLVLDKIEQHFKELVLSNSYSELTDILRGVLANHGRQYDIQQSMSNAVAVEVVHSLFSLANEAVRLVGNLAYLGGGGLYIVGAALESIGKRSNEIIGDIGYNPLKALASVLAAVVEGVGVLIKNSFGLKPLTEFLTKGIEAIRDATVRLINYTEITDANQAQAPDAELVDPLREPTPEVGDGLEALREPLLDGAPDSQALVDPTPPTPPPIPPHIDQPAGTRTALNFKERYLAQKSSTPLEKPTVEPTVDNDNTIQASL